MRMRNFALGLLTGFVGFVVWVVFSVFAGTHHAVYGTINAGDWAGIIIGFLIMLGGPLFFWVAYPLWRQATRRKK
jgi:hypothetical protein